MSEDLVYCVRGCVEPCRCTECLLADKPPHPPLRRQRDLGLLCKRCVTTLTRLLRDIPDLYATLDVIPAVTVSGDGASHQKVTGSPALVRLDIVALMDPRTAATSDAIDPATGKREEWDGSAYVPDEVGTWALLLAEECNVHSRISTMYEATRFLTGWMPELCASPWVDECYDALRDVERLLKRAHGDRRKGSVAKTCNNVYERDGQMITCNATLYVESATEAIRCKACGRRYEGYGLVALKTG